MKKKPITRNNESVTVYVTYFSRESGRVINEHFDCFLNQKWLQYTQDFCKSRNIEITDILQIIRSSKI